MESPERIEVEPEAIRIAWADGTAELLEAATLRRACPCAACGSRPPLDTTGASITTAHLVGDYALRITFGDGHATGIYPFDLLHTLGATV